MGCRLRTVQNGYGHRPRSVIISVMQSEIIRKNSHIVQLLEIKGELQKVLPSWNSVPCTDTTELKGSIQQDGRKKTQPRQRLHHMQTD